MQKIQKDDEVIVIAGKDKGRRGKVLRVLRDKKNVNVIVEDLNMVKKHVKPNPQLQKQGGIIELEAPIDASNVAIYNPLTKKADRVGVKILEGNKKKRYFKSNKELIDID